MTRRQRASAPAARGARPYASLSLWFDQRAGDGDLLVPRAPLDGDTEADVVIVGAGFTGLWTAYYLTELDPGLQVVVVEQEIAGFGASGRNGGWCSALLPTSAAAIAREHGLQAARAMRSAMRDAVVEVGGVAAAEGIACDFAIGGTVQLARSEAQLARARAEAAEAATWGDEVTLLDIEATREHVRAAGAIGASFTPDCARLHPGRLVRSLADVVEQRGVRIVEGTRALRLSPRAVVTDHGTVRAQHVIRATEAWTSQLPGSERDVVPVYSLMVATEPLPAEVWEQIGLARGETFSDHRHLIIYGQRTADDRLAFGGRGAPYHRGSRIHADFDQDAQVFAHLRSTLVELFPDVADAEITHRWGGPLGIARDWHASVGLDPSTGIGWAGGYVGDGVATSNLAGRTLADLVLGQDTPLTHLPWVGHRSPAWEPEPLRWTGINLGLRVATAADAEERATGRASVLARGLGRLTGG